MSEDIIIQRFAKRLNKLNALLGLFQAELTEFAEDGAVIVQAYQDMKRQEEVKPTKEESK